MTATKTSLNTYPRGVDLMLFDAVERCWRIGHYYIGDFRHEGFVDMSVPDFEFEYGDVYPDELIPYFTNVSHWAPLPDVPVAMAAAA